MAYILQIHLVENKTALCFHLGVRTDGLLALSAGVGAQLVKALDAHVLVVLLHALLAVQVVAAVEAVGAVGHGGGEVSPRTCGSDRPSESPFIHHRGAVLPRHLTLRKTTAQEKPPQEALEVNLTRSYK